MTLFVCHLAIWTCFGQVSTYHPSLHGEIQADGIAHDKHTLTAAHRTLPLGTRLLVYSPITDQSVVVTITDRGPFIPDRVLDLSNAAMEALRLTKFGVSSCRLIVLSTLTRQAHDRDSLLECESSLSYSHQSEVSSVQ